jgi:hypothetical protein
VGEPPLGEVVEDIAPYLDKAVVLGVVKDHDGWALLLLVVLPDRLATEGLLRGEYCPRSPHPGFVLKILENTFASSWP